MTHASRILAQLKQAEEDEQTPEELRDDISERREELEEELDEDETESAEEMVRRWRENNEKLH